MNRSRPSVPNFLITGFSKFPGAPVNPTEDLINWLKDLDLGKKLNANVRLLTLDTDYQKLDGCLDKLSAEFQPDIAVHFGLSAMAQGFQLERTAYNCVSQDEPDVSGYKPVSSTICDGPDSLETHLPVDEIYARLTRLNIPVFYSDSAGDYVCNYIFYRSVHGIDAKHQSRMSGFIHVPLLTSQLQYIKDDGVRNQLQSLSDAQLLDGAIEILSTCREVWGQGTWGTSGKARPV